MDKKDMAGSLFMLGLLGLIIYGMVNLQPEKPKAQTTAYEMKGFPSLPVSNQ